MLLSKFRQLPSLSKRGLLVCILLFSGSLFEAANGVGLAPKLSVGCFDSSSSGVDSLGRYIEYQPTILANFVGKRATIKLFINDLHTQTLKFSRNSSSYTRVEQMNFKVRVYRDRVELGMNEFKFDFQDSKKRGSVWICKTRLYETSFGRESTSSGPSTGSGGTYGRGIDGCTFKGIRLYGRVQIVDYFPDIKVQAVDFFPDLNVQKVDFFPTSCGKWQFVDYFPDFKVQFVNYFPDIKIRFVDYFPGLP